MESLKINLLNPKAYKLLKNLEDLRLISIEKYPDKSLKQFLNKLRSKTTISLEDISKEVDYVREKRYGFKNHSIILDANIGIRYLITKNHSLLDELLIN